MFLTASSMLLPRCPYQESPAPRLRGGRKRHGGAGLRKEWLLRGPRGVAKMRRNHSWVEWLLVISCHTHRKKGTNISIEFYFGVGDMNPLYRFFYRLLLFYDLAVPPLNTIRPLLCCLPPAQARQSPVVWLTAAAVIVIIYMIVGDLRGRKRPEKYNLNSGMHGESLSISTVPERRQILWDQAHARWNERKKVESTFSAADLRPPAGGLSDVELSRIKLGRFRVQVSQSSLHVTTRGHQIRRATPLRNHSRVDV
ncbi:hypothetical protein Q8A73_004180 [Channa argus]|nr:hypothetical protein Q8A73_004180 [Channa argus]